MLAKWCANLQSRYEEFEIMDLKKRHLHRTAYLSSEALQVYAEVHKCMFLIVRPDKNCRGHVEIMMVIARDSYSSLDPIYVINSVGQMFDLYLPSKMDKGGLSLFESTFRNAAEVCNYILLSLLF
jgi:hypothetical protein